MRDKHIRHGAYYRFLRDRHGYGHAEAAAAVRRFEAIRDKIEANAKTKREAALPESVNASTKRESYH